MLSTGLQSKPFNKIYLISTHHSLTCFVREKLLNNYRLLFLLHFWWVSIDIAQMHLRGICPKHKDYLSWLLYSQDGIAPNWKKKPSNCPFLKPSSTVQFSSFSMKHFIFHTLSRLVWIKKRSQDNEERRPAASW